MDQPPWPFWPRDLPLSSTGLLPAPPLGYWAHPDILTADTTDNGTPISAQVPMVNRAILYPFCKSEIQMDALDNPTGRMGRDVLIRTDSIPYRAIRDDRQSRIAGLLIQRGGTVSDPPCAECVRSAQRNMGMPTPFPICVRMLG